MERLVYPAVPGYEIFLGPGPVRSQVSKFFLIPVRSQVLKFSSVLVRFGPRFWSWSVLNQTLFSDKSTTLPIETLLMVVPIFSIEKALFSIFCSQCMLHAVRTIA